MRPLVGSQLYAHVPLCSQRLIDVVTPIVEATEPSDDDDETTGRSSLAHALSASVLSFRLLSRRARAFIDAALMSGAISVCASRPHTSYTYVNVCHAAEWSASAASAHSQGGHYTWSKAMSTSHYVALPKSSLRSLFSRFPSRIFGFELVTGDFDLVAECRYLKSLLNNRRVKGVCLTVNLRTEHFRRRVANDRNGERLAAAAADATAEGSSLVSLARRRVCRALDVARAWRLHGTLRAISPMQFQLLVVPRASSRRLSCPSRRGMTWWVSASSRGERRLLTACL